VITNLQNLKAGTPFRLQGTLITGTLLDCNECSAKVKLSGMPVDVEIEQPDGDVRRFTANRFKSTIWSPATVVETIDSDAAATSPTAELQPDAAQASLTEDEPMKTVTKTKKAPKAKLEPAAKAAKPVKERKAKSVGTPAPKEVTDQLDKMTDDLPDDQEKSAKPVKATNMSRKSGKAAAAKKLLEDAAENDAESQDGPKEPAEETPPPSPSKALREHPKPAAKTKMSLLDAAAEVMSDGQARNCEQIIKEILDRKLWNTSGKTPAATLYSAMHREINNPSGKASRFERTDAKGEFRCK